MLAEPKSVEFHEVRPHLLVFQLLLGAWTYEELGLLSDYKMSKPPLEEKTMSTSLMVPLYTGFH